MAGRSPTLEELAGQIVDGIRSLDERVQNLADSLNRLASYLHYPPSKGERNRC